MVELDFDAVRRMVDKYSPEIARGKVLGIGKILYLYREEKGISIEECADLYEKLYNFYLRLQANDNPDFVCGGSGTSPPMKPWAEKKRELVSEKPDRSFLGTRKWKYFITRLHRITRERWKERESYPLYSLIKILD